MGEHGRMVTFLVLVAAARLLVATVEAAWNAANDGEVGALLLSAGVSTVIAGVAISVVVAPVLWLSMYDHVLAGYAGGLR